MGSAAELCKGRLRQTNNQTKQQLIITRRDGRQNQPSFLVITFRLLSSVRRSWRWLLKCFFQGSFKRFVFQISSRSSREQILKQQQQHGETCRAMKKLNDAYLTLNHATNIFCRQKRWIVCKLVSIIKRCFGQFSTGSWSCSATKQVHQQRITVSHPGW
jgi:hypothetical protein